MRFFHLAFIPEENNLAYIATNRRLSSVHAPTCGQTSPSSASSSPAFTVNDLTSIDSLFVRLQHNTALTLQRYIPVLLRRILVPLGLQHLQRLDQFLPRLPRLNDSIQESPIGRHIRIGKAVAKLFNLLRPQLL